MKSYFREEKHKKGNIDIVKALWTCLFIIPLIVCRIIIAIGVIILGIVMSIATLSIKNGIDCIKLSWHVITEI